MSVITAVPVATTASEDFFFTATEASFSSIEVGRAASLDSLLEFNGIALLDMLRADFKDAVIFLEEFGRIFLGGVFSTDWRLTLLLDTPRLLLPAPISLLLLLFWQLLLFKSFTGLLFFEVVNWSLTSKSVATCSDIGGGES